MLHIRKGTVFTIESKIKLKRMLNHIVSSNGK